MRTAQRTIGAPLAEVLIGGGTAAVSEGRAEGADGTEGCGALLAGLRDAGTCGEDADIATSTGTAAARSHGADTDAPGASTGAAEAATEAAGISTTGTA